MKEMAVYKRRDSETGEVMTQSNILSSLVNIANMLAVDERVCAGSEILDPADQVIYAIRGGQREPDVDLTADYPEMLPHPFKEID